MSREREGEIEMSLNKHKQRRQEPENTDSEVGRFAGEKNSLLTLFPSEIEPKSTADCGGSGGEGKSLRLC